LQPLLDGMAQWEQEVFEKQYVDANWFKGKQAKHVKEMEMGRKRSKLGASSIRNNHRVIDAKVTIQC
jgi:hypothetical protein